MGPQMEGGCGGEKLTPTLPGRPTLISCVQQDTETCMSRTCLEVKRSAFLVCPWNQGLRKQWSGFSHWLKSILLNPYWLHNEVPLNMLRDASLGISNPWARAWAIQETRKSLDWTAGCLPFNSDPFQILSISSPTTTNWQQLFRSPVGRRWEEWKEKCSVTQNCLDGLITWD